MTSSKQITDASAGIVPVRKVNKVYLFLMLRSYSFWDFPKGMIEEGELPLSAAIREAQEEASLDPGLLRFNWGKDCHVTDPYRKHKDKIAIYFLAETDQTHIILPYSEEIGKPEHDEYRWMTYIEAKKLANERIGKVLDWAQRKIKGKR